MESLYIAPAHRRHGIASMFVEQLAQVEDLHWQKNNFQIAHSEHAARIEWNVLDWNTPAIQFYRSFNATDWHDDERLVLFRFDEAQIEQIAVQAQAKMANK